MKNVRTRAKAFIGTVALLITLLGASYLSAATSGLCSDQIDLITGVLDDTCGDYSCEFTCSGGQLTEADCDCE